MAMLAPGRRPTLASPIPPSLPSAFPRPASVQSFNAPRHTSDTAGSNGHGASDTRNVRVVLRVRPPNPDDATVPPRFRQTLLHPTSGSDIRIDVDPATLAGQGVGSSSAGKRHPTFSFDHILGEDSSQADLFDVTGRDVVDEFLNGHNVTFLAYGQTSSGKSYSMGTSGDDEDYTGASLNARTGLIPRTVQTIFERAEQTRLASGAGANWDCRLSFLELYNEEILDLLSGSGVQISIREERDGRIVWAGVREVKVKSLEEVMALLQEGSARRKTGETGMNASSSRSHAIFSLSLVQKRRTGITTSASQPVSTDSPLRSLKRPTSMIGFGIGSSRSPTPSGSRVPPSSFASTQKTGPARPNSLHIAAVSPESEFIIVSSKFNMVDLAGSERLKRTAAQGERMKEGISINSGLLALGNVISTLCDSVKSRGHIPYRDSKLTRMLQDSIGGNSLTTMIACVSGIEYNISETLNTIKYASRARNIRNQAKINVVEAGWDDVEHLQNTVLKLRKQVAGIVTEGQDGRTGTLGGSEGHTQKLVGKLAELQRDHTDLYDQYLQKCSENMRLNSELRSAKPVDADALAKFNETVEPVILEYEKVVAALNKQLEGLRMELAVLSNLHDDKDQQIAERQDRQTQSEAYVQELRNRVGKLGERNASGEAYILDLEAKLKIHSDKEAGHSDLISDLRKEIGQLKESNSDLGQHTIELEGRLVQSDTHTSGLFGQIEKQEKEFERREAAYRDLESHIALLDASRDNKALLHEVNARERRTLDMEPDRRYEQDTSEQENKALARSIGAERLTQSELRSHLFSLQTSTASGHADREASSVSFANAREPTPNGRSPIVAPIELTPPDSPANGSITAQDRPEQLSLLRAKLHKAEAQIVDLSAQLSEAKLVHAELHDVLPSSPVISSPNPNDEGSDTGTTLQTPPVPTPSSSPTRSRGIRPGPLSVLSTAAFQSRVARKDFWTGRGYGDPRRIRPQSLSQELSSAQSSALLPRQSWAGPSSLLLSGSPTQPSSLAMQPSLRSSQSWESELKYVHSIVDSRNEELQRQDCYIHQLEDLLRQAHLIPSHKSRVNPLIITPDRTPSPISIPLPPSPHNLAPAALPDTDSLHPLSTGGLSPHSVKRFGDLKESLDRFSQKDENGYQSRTKVDDLIKEMTVKEASQRGIIKQQFVQIADLQKINNRLRGVNGSPRIDDVDQQANEIPHFSEANSHGSNRAVDKFSEEHSRQLLSLTNGHAQRVASLQKDHDTAVEELRQSLHLTQQGHADELNALQRSHHDALDTLTRTHEDTLSALQTEHEIITVEISNELATSEEQRRQLKMRADQAQFELSRVRDEHQLRHNTDVRQISELQRANNKLEKAKTELDIANNDMSKRIAELGQRSSRKTGMPPPQGPPPTTPLPPIPSTSGVQVNGSSYFPKTRSDESASGAPSSSSTSSSGHSDTAARSLFPENDQVVRTITKERDMLVQRVDAESQQMQDTKTRLEEEIQQNARLNRELADARKTSSKLRAHLEDVRQEHKRVTETCKEHLEELNERRDRMDKTSRDSKQERDSLIAANTQVATLKAQLDRAMDAKVNKTLNSRLKVI